VDFRQQSLPKQHGCEAINLGKNRCSRTAFRRPWFGENNKTLECTQSQNRHDAAVLREIQREGRGKQ